MLADKKASYLVGMSVVWMVERKVAGMAELTVEKSVVLTVDLKVA